jgi:hypothetical protein
VSDDHTRIERAGERLSVISASRILPFGLTRLIQIKKSLDGWGHHIVARQREKQAVAG